MQKKEQHDLYIKKKSIIKLIYKKRLEANILITSLEDFVKD